MRHRSPRPIASASTLVAATLLAGAALAAPGSSAPLLPHLAVAPVSLAEPGALPGWVVWSAWPDADPAARSGATSEARSVVLLASHLTADLGDAQGTGFDEPWTLLVEATDDATRAALFGVAHGTLRDHPTLFGSAELVALPLPTAEADGSAVTVCWDAASRAGVPLDAGDGLAGYAISRASLSGDRIEVGRVAAGASELAFTEADVPVGWWQYGVSAVVVGDVAGTVRSTARPVSVVPRNGLGDRRLDDALRPRPGTRRR